MPLQKKFMKNFQRKNRQSIRLPEYDYNSGIFFVTICSFQRECVFGEVVGKKVLLNDMGKIVKNFWEKIPENFEGVSLGEFCVMPNHMHGILRIKDDQMEFMKRATTRVAPTGNVGVGLVPTQQKDGEISGDPEGGHPRGVPLQGNRQTKLGSIIGGFKSLSTVEIIKGVKIGILPEFSGKIWQRNYYERIIRDEKSLEDVRNYILANPQKWSEDPDNPENFFRHDFPKGKITAFPTDTSFGLGVRADDEMGLQKLADLKGGREGKYFSLMCGSWEMLEKFAEIPEIFSENFDENFFTEKPRTGIFKPSKNCPKSDFWPEKGVAFRVTTNEDIAKVIEAMGVMVTATSANFSGERAIYDVKILEKNFGDKVQIFFPSPEVLPEIPASEIWDFTGEELKRVR